jgi:DNA-binding PadR family transcriptional regulator
MPMSPMIKLPLTLEHALLGFLRERPMHAYEIHQHLLQNEALGRVWRLKQSQLYALLARLEEAGYIEASIEPQGNRPPRRVLHLTPPGAEAFQHWLRDPVAHGRDFRQEFLAKLFFAQRDSPASSQALVADQRTACQHWLAELQTQVEQLGDARSYDWLVLQFRISTIQAFTDWLDICAQTLTTPSGF